ncbi:MAG: GNAT family N-acetyltransferase [Acetobacter sp.]|nr:GNAT family N-acetyltransferase [Acetobacter sp.]
MLENFSDMVFRSWEKIQCASEVNDSRVKEYNCRMLEAEHIRDICHIYETYSGCKEFLYVPSKEEIEKNVTASTSCYVGMFDDSNNLMGVAKLERLQFPYPFFALPKDEQDSEGDCYGLSGLLVASEHRNKGVAKRLVNVALGALHLYGAKGVYADCEYRNQASFATLSHTLNFVGYTDGRNGAEGEKTVYLTFYRNSAEKYQETQAGIALDFAKAETLDDVVGVLQSQLQGMGKHARLTTPYQEGYNELNLLDTPVLTPKMKLILEPEGRRKAKTVYKNKTVFGKGEDGR